uniref:Protein tyrosine kinase n=1 Tax=Corethrella appendiculata TaxID=1370023 RepID=W4VRJ9_9DIPT
MKILLVFKKLSVIILFVQITLWIDQINLVKANDEDDFLELLIERVFNGAPKIHPLKSDITLQKAENFRLECESHNPVTWLVSELEGEDSDIEIRSVPTENLDRPYGSILEFKNASFRDVKRYYCVNNASVSETHNDEGIIDNDKLEQLSLEYKSSTIYVFVDDPDIHLVPILLPVISVDQHKDVVIPCKPTMKTTQVSLFKDEYETPIANAPFDPTVGFTIKIRNLHDGGFFICRVEGHQDEDLHFQVEVREVSLTQFIEKPKIESSTGNHATVGDQINLTCTVDVLIGVLFSMEWYLPNHQKATNTSNVQVYKPKVEHETKKNGFNTGTTELIIKNVDKSYSGLYRCDVIDGMRHNQRSTVNITVLNSAEGYINLEEESDLSSIEVNAKQGKVKIIVKYQAYPKPDFFWFNNHNEDISDAKFSNNDKYMVETTDKYVSLTIRHLELNDMGEYILKAHNGITEQEFGMELIVKDKPIIKLESIYMKREQGGLYNFPVTLIGYPKPEHDCYLNFCDTRKPWPFCRGMIDGAPPRTRFSLTEKRKTIFEGYIPVSKDTGSLRIICTANNTEGYDEAEAYFMIGDLDESVTVQYESEMKKPYTIGDNVSLLCGVLIYNYTDHLQWYKDGHLVVSSTDVTVISNRTQYTYWNKINFNNVQLANAGIYECRAAPTDDSKGFEIKTINLEVIEPEHPKFLSESVPEVYEPEIGETVEFKCDLIGIPEPEIQWYKNDELVDFNANESRGISQYEMSLLIQSARPMHSGDFKCTGVNKVGSISRQFKLDITEMEGIKKTVVYGVAAFIMALILIIIIILARYIRAKKHLQEMKAAGLSNFEEGCIDSFNPEIGLDEQADLLPYKQRFEFPREKLKLGKQLGAGAFGVVMKATAEGIIPYEDESTVAVKMVKKQTDNEVMRALISELKIMVHLGQHLNVVNLLGAITKNIAKRELMVIVEYCQFGNVQQFLQKHKAFFVDQINAETGEIDHSVQQNEFRWSTNSNYEFNRVSGNSEPGDHINSRGYVRHSGMGVRNKGMINSTNTETTLITTIGDETDTANSPLWRSNYRMDYKGPARSVNTTDLVSWAAQVASGMEYLSSKKVLHGDLAARNILLCDNNVVKICDFGLARSMYKNDNYKKESKGPLPFKWLALECISDSIFSTYSDVWAYGIVLWEFFSLGTVPYPGMNADEQLYIKLKNSYRMEKPKYSNQDVYDIMLNCWNVKPDSRPSFKELKYRFEAMLPDEIKNHYIDLNQPYLAMNDEQKDNGEIDYLAALGPPDEFAPKIPHSNYVNGIILPLPPIKELENSGEYLKMNSSKTDLEMIDNNDHFDFSKLNRTGQYSPTTKNNLDTTPPQGSKKHHKKSGLPEEIPMLNKHGNVNSDSDSELGSPSPLPRTTISSISDNTTPYVNVNSQNNSKNDAFSNPGYVTLNTVNEKSSPVK